MIFTQNPVATRVKQPRLATAQIANTNVTNQVNLFTAGASGSKVVGILLTSSDTASRNITINANNGSTAFPIVTVPVAGGAGNGTINAVSVFAIAGPSGLSGMLPVDNDGQAYFFVEGSNTITFSSGAALTNNSVFITGIVTYGDF